MSGDLSLGGHVARGLPTSYPPLYEGDEAVSWSQAVRLTSDAVDAQARKPIITVWAEEKGPIRNNAFEWSFGDGAAGVAHSGYTMMAPGRVLRMGLAANSSGDVAKVNLVVNGIEHISYGVTKPAGQYSGTSSFETPLEVSTGDRLNFRSAMSNRNILAAVVSLLIELNIE